MNRVIKFRGIIKYPDDIFRGFWYGNLMIYANGDTFIRQIETGQEFEVIPETVGQFTGLTDKNGKEIYEGDIICRKKIRGLDKYKIVIWHNAYVATGFNISNTKERIIIGNIYDNPELIQQP